MNKVDQVQPIWATEESFIWCQLVADILNDVIIMMPP